MTPSTQWMPWHPWARGTPGPEAPSPQARAARHARPGTRGPARPIPARGWAEWRISTMVPLPANCTPNGTVGMLFLEMLNKHAGIEHEDVTVRRRYAWYINRYISKHTDYQGMYNARSCKERDYVWLEVRAD